jgi:cytochrome c oxidase subunit 2
MTFAGAALAAPVAQAADGGALYARCVACHGARGEGVAATGGPAIAGMEPWYIERQLRNFASGLRGSRTGDTRGQSMRAASATLASDAERQAVAAHVAALPRPRVAAVGAPTASGRNYFNAICSACHGSNGLGNEKLGAPRIAGRTPEFLAGELAAFRSGRRGAQEADRLGAQMRAIVAMLPDAATERDVVGYAASLGQ